MTKDKPPLPDNLRSVAIAARARAQKRAAPPPLADTVSRPENESRDYLSGPYAEADWELWVYLLLDAFGTRNLRVANAFMRQLGDMCPEVFDGEDQRWILDGDLFQQALSIVRSFQPRNEAETAMAVQAVSTHFAAMKMAVWIGSRSSIDPHTAGTIAALNKAYAQQLTAMNALRSGGKAKRQFIKVQKSVTVNHWHDEKHVHLPGQGGRESNGQPDATRGQRAHATPTGSLVELPALPCQDTSGEALPFAGCAGQAKVPIARGSEGERSA